MKTEDDPLDHTPPESVRSTLEAILYLESAVTGAGWTEGVVLRYGGFYGPGTSLSPEGGEMVEAVRQRKFPVVGSGAGVWSFIHIEDAADATVAAIEHGRRGWRTGCRRPRVRWARRSLGACRAGSAGYSPARP